MRALLFAYIVPLGAVVLGPMLRRHPQWFPSLARRSGGLEYLIGHVRDHTLGPLALGVGLWRLSTGAGAPFGPLGLAVLSYWSYRRHVRVGLQMTEFMRANPLAHPGEFFDHYYRRLGVASTPVPAKATRSVDPALVSYRTGAPKRQSVWILAHALYDTAIFARSAYRAITEVGEAYGRDVFDVMASLWGSRMLQLFHLEMRCEGLERFADLDGKILLVCNHKSHLDFVFTFFALARARTKSGRALRPRFIAAKDHFVDSWLVREGLGIGKLIAAVDMVFVDRKGRGVAAMREAAEKLAEKTIDIAVFPQGTRAAGLRNVDGEREDAGFYTTGTPERPYGHLKKGCAYLALDAALASRVPVHLVFVGIDGTGEVVPKGELAIQTESVIRFAIGEVLTLRPSDVRDLARPEERAPRTSAERRYLERVETLQREVNRGLVGAMDWHRRLVRWFEDELAAQGVGERERQTVVRELERLDQAGEVLPFARLDHLRIVGVKARPLEEILPGVRGTAAWVGDVDRASESAGDGRAGGHVPGEKGSPPSLSFRSDRLEDSEC